MAVAKTGISRRAPTSATLTSQAHPPGSPSTAPATPTWIPRWQQPTLAASDPVSSTPRPFQPESVLKQVPAPANLVTTDRTPNSLPRRPQPRQPQYPSRSCQLDSRSNKSTRSTCAASLGPEIPMVSLITSPRTLLRRTSKHKLVARFWESTTTLSSFPSEPSQRMSMRQPSQWS